MNMWCQIKEEVKFGKKSNQVKNHDLVVLCITECHWAQQNNTCKSQMGQDQVSGGVSVVCWHAAPVTNVL